MPERLKDLISAETLAILLKVIPVALMATIISTAVKMKKEKNHNTERFVIYHCRGSYCLDFIAYCFGN